MAERSALTASSPAASDLLASPVYHTTPTQEWNLDYSRCGLDLRSGADNTIIRGHPDWIYNTSASSVHARSGMRLHCAVLPIHADGPVSCGLLSGASGARAARVSDVGGALTMAGYYWPRLRILGRRHASIPASTRNRPLQRVAFTSRSSRRFLSVLTGWASTSPCTLLLAALLADSAGACLALLADGHLRSCSSYHT